MRKLVILLACLLSLPSYAHVCTVPTFYDGWSASFQGTNTVSGFIYGLDETFLYVILTNGYINGFVDVPTSFPMAFQQASSPDQFYASQISTYHETLMTESCQNLVTENGSYILVR